MEKIVMEKQDLHILEISIIRLKHDLKAEIEKSGINYKKGKKYIELKNEFDQKLDTLKELNFSKYKSYCLDNVEIIDKNRIKEFENTQRYNNLNIDEIELFKKYNYDYKEDKLKLFTLNPIDSMLTKEWLKLQKRKSSMSLRELSMSRNWNS